MLIPFVFSLALHATSEMPAAEGFCAFPAAQAAQGGPAEAGPEGTGDGIRPLHLRVVSGADRARPRNGRVWLELWGAHRVRGRAMPFTGGDGPDLVILSEQASGGLTLSLRADGSAALVLVPEGSETPILRKGRCGGVAWLLAARDTR